MKAKYLAIASFILAAGCVAPPQQPSPEAGTAPEDLATAIVLPDGTKCNFAGRGATLTYEDQRLNYTCSDTLGLIGDVAIANGTDITVTTATLEGANITGSEPLTFTLQAIELADGTVCLNAGQGATLAYEGKRLNFTCNDDLVLVGDIVQSEETFIAEKAVLEGTDFVSSDPFEIQILGGTTLN
ncbi:MAG: hypothetical protein EA342_03475 [Leptolyngbya sp. LCM1.Bin17]|nr:MAG: hypothetical protein EA342_03475 [Leptolyngbya sp. LCM1.Bin17]